MAIPPPRQATPFPSGNSASTNEPVYPMQQATYNQILLQMVNGHDQGESSSSTSRRNIAPFYAFHHLFIITEYATTYPLTPSTINYVPPNPQQFGGQQRMPVADLPNSNRAPNSMPASRVSQPLTLENIFHHFHCQVGVYQASREAQISHLKTAEFERSQHQRELIQEKVHKDHIDKLTSSHNQELEGLKKTHRQKLIESERLCRDWRSKSTFYKWKTKALTSMVKKSNLGITNMISREKEHGATQLKREKATIEQCQEVHAAIKLLRSDLQKFAELFPLALGTKIPPVLEQTLESMLHLSTRIASQKVAYQSNLAETQNRMGEEAIDEEVVEEEEEEEAVDGEEKGAGRAEFERNLIDEAEKHFYENRPRLNTPRSGSSWKAAGSSLTRASERLKQRKAEH